MVAPKPPRARHRQRPFFQRPLLRRTGERGGCFHLPQRSERDHEETPRQGHATLVTAAWATEVQNQGRQPLYSTLWSNGASLGVARKLQTVRFGADLHVA